MTETNGHMQDTRHVNINLASDGSLLPSDLRLRSFFLQERLLSNCHL